MPEGDFDYYEIFKKGDGVFFLDSCARTKLDGKISFSEVQRPNIIVDKTLAYVLFELVEGKTNVGDIFEKAFSFNP